MSLHSKEHYQDPVDSGGIGPFNGENYQDPVDSGGIGPFNGENYRDKPKG